MLNLKPFGQNADRCNLTRGQSLDRQQSLVLMRLDTSCARSRFAEVQEAADLVAEIGERGVVNSLPRSLGHIPNYIVIRY